MPVRVTWKRKITVEHRPKREYAVEWHPPFGRCWFHWQINNSRPLLRESQEPSCAERWSEREDEM
jgi:hypothetical protein